MTYDSSAPITPTSNAATAVITAAVIANPQVPGRFGYESYVGQCAWGREVPVAHGRNLSTTVSNFREPDCFAFRVATLLAIAFAYVVDYVDWNAVIRRVPKCR